MRNMILTTLFVVVATGCASYHKDAGRVQSTATEQQLSPKAQVAAIEASCIQATDAMKQRHAEKSLYLRLGGREGLKEIATRLYAAHAANEQIGHMFAHVPSGPFIEHVTDFLVANSGGEGAYTRSMAEVHQHLRISYSDFLSAGGDVQSVMKGLGHGDQEIQEAVCFLVSFVPQVVKDDVSAN